MGKKRFVTALAALALAGAGFATPAFAEDTPQDLAVTEKMYFTDSCGDIVTDVEEGTSGRGFSADVKAGWTFHWVTDEPVPQALFMHLYKQGDSLASVRVDKGEKADFAWKVDLPVGTVVGGVSIYQEGDIPVLNVDEVAEGPTGDYLVHPSGEEMSFTVQGVDSGCVLENDEDGEGSEGTGGNESPSGGVGESSDPVDGVLASATSPEGWVVSVSDVPENADVNVIELSARTEPVLIEEAGWSRLSSFLFVADGQPGGDGYARVNVRVGKEYAGRQVKLAGLGFSKAAELAGNYHHGVDFGPVTVDADGNAFFDIDVRISGIDPSEYANHDHNEFGDYTLDVLVQGEKIGSQTSSSNSAQAVNNASVESVQAKKLPDTGVNAGVLAGGVVTALLAGAGLLAMRRRNA